MKKINLLITAVLTLNFTLLARLLLIILLAGGKTLHLSAQVIAGGKYHSLTLCSDGTVKSWGHDVSGQLGNDAAAADQSTSVSVAITGITAIAASEHQSFALKSDGTVWAWGENGLGQLGVGLALVDQFTPVQVASLTGIIAIAAGQYHSLALKSDGTVWAWGQRVYGAVGNGAFSLSVQSTPTQVLGPGGAGFLTGITAIAAGGYHSLAVKSDGTVWAWGRDLAGQLGDDVALTDKSSPVQVATLTGITAVSGGFMYSVALKNDGTVWSWGNDGSGQLGNDAALVQQPTPVQVATLTGITAIAAGEFHCLALKSDGTVWAWGEDTGGQLGNDAALVQQPTPVQVATLTGITAIAGGGYHSLAVKSNGTVWSWGEDTFGELGNDVVLANQSMPVQVAALAGCVAPLPIELLSFTANCSTTPNTVRVAWSTATEVNNDYFTIERAASHDPSKGGGLNWEAAGIVKGAGNSSSTRNYEFADKLPSTDYGLSTIYYRLKQTDFDGKTEVFNNQQVAVDVTECAVMVFPNPAGNTLHVPYVAEQDGEITLQVYDVIGKLVKEKLVAAIKGNNMFTLDLTTVAQGLYVLRVKGAAKANNQKFVKVDK